MPEITRRRTGEMLRELFEVLMPVSDGMQAREALTALEKRLTLSDYETVSMLRGVDDSIRL